jgi:hypothetical protein
MMKVLEQCHRTDIKILLLSDSMIAIWRKKLQRGADARIGRWKGFPPSAKGGSCKVLFTKRSVDVADL